MKARFQYLFLPNFANEYKAFGSTLLFLFLSIHLLSAQSREDQIKAVFLFNFTQFVDWPSSAFSSADSPFIIGIIGNDPFGNYLDETVAGEKMLNHPLIIQRYKDVKDIQNCHLLFIGVDDPQKIKSLLIALSSRNILTVSDASNFANSGGMIRFFTKDNKTRLQINPTAAKAAALNISSKLLRVAEITE